MLPKIVLTDFARKRHTRDSGRSYHKHNEGVLIAGIYCNWDTRRPGNGRIDLTQVVIVPLQSEQFACNTVLVEPHTELLATVDCRQQGEEPFIKVLAGRLSPTVECKYAWAVLYHRDVLKPEEREGVEADWYIVSLGASDVQEEPMHPLTMARNQLGLVGGTKVSYTADEWARAVHYWSIRCQREV